MSFNEVIAELPRLTLEERQILIRRCQRLMKSWLKNGWPHITTIQVLLSGLMK